MKMLRKRRMFASRAIMSAVAFATLPAVAFAQIATLDDPNLNERSTDKAQNERSKETKATDQTTKKSVVCTYFNKYRNEMFRRSPAEALKRDAANVSMIRYYAKKYNVPEGLAMSVSYQEARFDTCAGSHTGVKGVMQLTKGTAKGMGFDRDINEQNIEGGVKYLGMGVQRCGSTNYSCLAKWYNGSNANEQRSWAAGVARYHGYFNNYASSGTAPAVTPPKISISTVDASGGSSAQKGAASSSDGAASSLAYSQTKMIENGNAMDALLANVGQTSEYKDAWEDNAQARSMNVGLYNEYLKAALALNQVINGKMQLSNSSMSQAARSVTKPKDVKVNPYSCDPAELQAAKIALEFWPTCAKEVWAATNGASGQSNVINADAAATAAHIEMLQSQ